MLFLINAQLLLIDFTDEIQLHARGTRLPTPHKWVDSAYDVSNPDRRLLEDFPFQTVEYAFVCVFDVPTWYCKVVWERSIVSGALKQQ